MTTRSTLTVRLSPALSEHVANAVGEESGSYENVSEYIRDLIRRDMEGREQQRFERLKSELQLAFAQPDGSYAALRAEDIVRRSNATG